MPYLYLIGSGQAFNVWTLPANIAGVVGQPVNNDLSIAKPGANSTIAVMVTDKAGAPVANAPVSWTSRGVTFNNSSSNTNALGIATTDVTIARTGSFDINVTAGGLSTAFDSSSNNLVPGALDHNDTIDEKIRTRAEHWRLERLAIVDRNVLRLAVYDFLYVDTPHTVVINEALEIARRFSTFEATQFINGILDAIKLDLEKTAPEETAKADGKSTGS